MVLHAKLRAISGDAVIWGFFSCLSSVLTAASTLTALAESRWPQAKTAQIVLLFTSILFDWCLFGATDLSTLWSERAKKYASEQGELTNYRWADLALPVLGIVLSMALALTGSFSDSVILSLNFRAAAPILSQLFATIASSIIKEEVQRLNLIENGSLLRTRAGKGEPEECSAFAESDPLWSP